MNVLGSGLYLAGKYEDALSVQEANLSMRRRLDAAAHSILVAQCNLANTYAKLGRDEEALSMRREVYSGRLKLNGEEHRETLREADNYALSLLDLEHFEDAKSLLRKTMPMARRVLGESNDVTIRMSRSYTAALYKDDNATLDNLREAVTMLEETARTARCVLGGAHPTTALIDKSLRIARAKLSARENAASCITLDCLFAASKNLFLRGRLLEVIRGRRSFTSDGGTEEPPSDQDRASFPLASS